MDWITNVVGVFKETQSAIEGTVWRRAVALAENVPTGEDGKVANGTWPTISKALAKAGVANPTTGEPLNRAYLSRLYRVGSVSLELDALRSYPLRVVDVALQRSTPEKALAKLQEREAKGESLRLHDVAGTSVANVDDLVDKLDDEGTERIVSRIADKKPKAVAKAVRRPSVAKAVSKDPEARSQVFRKAIGKSDETDRDALDTVQKAQGINDALDWQEYYGEIRTAEKLLVAKLDRVEEWRKQFGSVSLDDPNAPGETLGDLMTQSLEEGKATVDAAYSRAGVSNDLDNALNRMLGGNS